MNRHFIEISQLSPEQIHTILHRAIEFKAAHSYPSYKQHTLANLFYENSTRTRVSFELAAQKLSIPVINLDLQHSSESKGETIEDTINNLAAMGIDLFVLRHSENKLIYQLSQKLASQVHLINAGSGQHAHPSQAMLDLMTIYQHKPALNQLKIAIIGDIKHSRVANSLQTLFSIIQIKELVFIAPELWQPPSINFGRTTTSLEEGLAEADIIICLRVQKERLNISEHLDLERYRKAYSLTQESIKYAKSDALILHPGPVNHGVEIESQLVTCPQSLILEQVRNGVYMRMAILESCLINISK